jgi:recombination protein RecA
MIALGEKMKLIQKSGSSYAYGDIKLGRGYDATRQFLKDKENKDIKTKILKEIREELKKAA